jgi:phospholipid/cholesterol/gamma-HCH transport system substrate-binding protein
LCKSTPLAPICSPLGDAVTELCTLLPDLPLCSQNANVVSSLLGQVGQGSGSASPNTQTKPGVPTLPDFLKPPAAPDSGGGGSGGSFVDKLFGGLLGGGSR